MAARPSLARLTNKLEYNIITLGAPTGSLTTTTPSPAATTYTTTLTHRPPDSAPVTRTRSDRKFSALAPIESFPRRS